MRKRYMVLTGMTAVILASVLYGEALHVDYRLSSQTAGKPTDPNKDIAELEKQIAGRENQPAEQAFKNIQILKGFPASRVLRIMGTFTKVIGVDCTHCHVAGQWEKEDKQPKQTARSMWSLMAKVNGDLKEAIGKGTVNCYTCHRGQTRPALNPPSTN